VSTRRTRILVLGVVAATMLVPAGAAAAEPTHATPSTLFGAACKPNHGCSPTTIALPDGFQPEGIAIGRLPYAYFGSLADGSIYRASLVTGRGKIISEGPGTQSVGLKIDGRGRLFVAGGAAGDARVVSALTGEVLASYQLTSGNTFVNDVIVTPDAAWFTDSFNPVLYQVPLGRRGALPEADQVVTVPLTGDYQQGDGFNANGISRTPDGAGLLLMQSNTATLFRVDPATGEATTVDLGGATLPNGDGILLRGRTLYVVQNQLNQVAVVRLDRAGSSGTVVAEITDPGFDVPTTVAAFGNRLYLPNARFGTEPTPETEYTAVAVRR
jgi:sugar lactone lactonase YvrE